MCEFPVEKPGLLSRRNNPWPGAAWPQYVTYEKLQTGRISRMTPETSGTMNFERPAPGL